MNGVKHHLIGYLDSSCITSTVIDYKNKAVELIDKLLEENTVPIIVGGTHYYIHSILYDCLIDQPVQTETPIKPQENSLYKMFILNI